MISILLNLWILFKEIMKTIIKKTNSPYLPPIVSGGASILLFKSILDSDLGDIKFYVAMAGNLFLFLVSAVAYCYLRRMEKDKDQYLLSTVGKIVEDVFKHYGVSMASNAAGPAAAKEMNPIMQTIVDMVRGLKELVEKGYK